MFKVVVRGGLEVQAVYGVIFPSGACVGFLMYEYGASHWSMGHSIVVKGSENFHIGQYGSCCILLL